MANASPPELDLPPLAPEPAPMEGRNARMERLRGIALYGLLLVMLCVVMLPLAWMIATAFKIPGTAFQLRFLPQTTLMWPAEQDPALPLVQVGDSELLYHFEYADPRATTVVAEWRAAGTEEDGVAVELTSSFDRLWIATGVIPDAPEAIEVRFIPGGEQPTAWERAERREDLGFFAPGEPQAFVAVREGEVVAELRGEAGRGLSIALEGQRRALALQEREGAFRGTTSAAALPADAGYRVQRRVSFGEAVGTLYTLENFRAIMFNPEFNFLRYFWNSLVVATFAAFLTVLICTLAAYAFSVFQFRWREPIFILLLMSMLVPGMIYMVPQFSITLQLGLMNSYTGMIVPHLGNVFGLFLLRQYIDQIPRDLFAAAEIDGASDQQSFRTIVIPVCLPIMVTLFLLVFVTQWSNFLWQLIINTGDSRVLTLPVGLQQFRGQNASEWEKIMAGACFSLIPISVLFLSLQKYFLKGLVAGSVKE